MRSTELYWLPPMPADWRARVAALGTDPGQTWPEAVALAGTRLDFMRTNALEERVRRALADTPPGDTQPVRLAILGSCTLSHLHAGIRVASLRRNLALTTYENDYGQYFQEIMNPASGLHAFRPTAVLFAFDARHLVQGLTASMSADEVRIAIDDTMERIRQCWNGVRDAFSCIVLQQTVIDGFASLIGQNEHRLPGSRSRAVALLNAKLRQLADAEGVDLVAVDRQLQQDGLGAWHDPSLWHRTKQDIIPTAAPAYGELVARIIAAKRGLSKKCLVLDLDNTLWGGVVGDDGLAGIVLGQGSGEGEEYAEFQDYARELSRRGVILAVCSKNDADNAWEPFDRHPETVLRRGDIACFQANWDDKATNIRIIAETLNIGLDSLVFVDDNPFERNLVRQELPMVAVPEVPDDPSLIPRVLADAGYFEAVTLTDEDRERSRQYQGNLARETLRASVTDLDSYLRSLEMQLLWQRFDALGMQRIVQLINKTNQFNLTTQRYTDAAVTEIMQDPHSFGLQLRLLDRFGDNGIIAIVIGRMLQPSTVTIDTWLMSCRVLGRQVEQATLGLVVGEARRLGATRVVGEYLPTKKNRMVQDHYKNLGFDIVERRDDGGSTAMLDLDGYEIPATFHEIREVESA